MGTKLKKSEQKTEVISLRVRKEIREKLETLASDRRRELADFLRLLLEDVADGRIKITL